MAPSSEQEVSAAEGIGPVETSCLVAIHHWDMVKSAIADHAWRFAALADEVS